MERPLEQTAIRATALHERLRSLAYGRHSLR